MKALILNIGDELLVGQTINSNAARMGSMLNMIGIHTARILVIPDKKDEILSAMNEGLNYDVVLMTGGLGPTKDDITKKTFADFFNTPLVLNETVLNDVTAYFHKRGRQMTELNRMQAWVPEGCRVIRNPNGTAPGMWMKKNNTIFISMPGVPYEMQAMMENVVIPELRRILAEKHPNRIFHHSVITVGIGESLLAEKIAEWEDHLTKDSFTLAYLPQPGIVKLRISHYNADENTPDKARKHITELKKIIEEWYLGEEIFGDAPLTVQRVISELFKERKITLGFAESCTGGYLSHLITSIPGSSEFFKGSCITYSNEAKMNVLGVKPETLEKFGAVSEECVKEMLAGCLRKLKCDYGIAVSGIAGPDGGTDEKPVGSVWLAFGSALNMQTLFLKLGGNRERNIHLASIYGLNELRKLFKK
jgi:nicotinamide-nucleotide amidase